MLFAPFKLCQPPHFVGRELKIEYFRIFLDVRGIARARDHRDVTLQIPAQNDLSGGLSVGAADPDDLGVLENGGCPTSAAEGIPALHDDSLFLLLAAVFLSYARNVKGRDDYVRGTLANPT